MKNEEGEVEEEQQGQLVPERLGLEDDSNQAGAERTGGTRS